MNATPILTRNTIEEKAAALKARMATCSTKPEFVSKVVVAGKVDCNPDEFNAWHANSDNNSARTPWGTLPTGRN